VYSRVLVPFDGSEISHNAVRWAERLVAPTRAEMLLLRVVSPLAAPFSARPTPSLLAAAAKEEERAVKAAATQLSNLAHALHGRDIQASRFVQVGTPALDILAFVKEHRVDLVVMGTHGRGGASRAILGSVADEVRRGAAVPVLLIPSTAEPPLGEMTVLICLDGSAEAESSLDAGLPLAVGLGAQVVLFEAAGERHDSCSAAAYLEAKAAGVEALGLPVSTVVGRGDPGLGILLQADIFQPCVIALASHGRSGVPRALLGSVASQVIGRSHMPVLLARRAVARQDVAGPRLRRSFTPAV
jgi:nucleotide-binding universal stress UspA family protein